MFRICITAALILIFSPLLIRLGWFRTAIASFLRPLGELAYKNAYISMMSSLLGSAIAISGAIWTQRVLRRIDADKKAEEENIKIRAEAELILYEFNSAIDNLRNILQFTYPLIESNQLPASGGPLVAYSRYVRALPIICDQEIRANILHIRGYLTSDTVKSLLGLQLKIQKIANLTDQTRKNIGIDDYQIAYNTTCTLFQGIPKKGKAYAVNYELKEELKKALDALAEFANPQNSKETNA